MHIMNKNSGASLILRALATASVILGAAVCAALWAHGRSMDTDTTERTAQYRRAVPPGMVLIPGGSFLQGSDDADADDDVRPRRRESIPSFYMDLHEVTNREFHRFDPSHAFPAGEEDLPAGGITYAAAAAYAGWVGKRLPTEAEWEKAARGTDGRRYPWGDVWDPGRVAPRRRRSGDRGVPLPIVTGKLCSFGPSRLQRIGSRPTGASPYGCLDMAGNAWEWVQGYYNGNRSQRILRGGAVGYGERSCRTYARAVEGSADT